MKNILSNYFSQPEEKPEYPICYFSLLEDRKKKILVAEKRHLKEGNMEAMAKCRPTYEFITRRQKDYLIGQLATLHRRAVNQPPHKLEIKPKTQL